MFNEYPNSAVETGVTDGTKITQQIHSYREELLILLAHLEEFLHIHCPVKSVYKLGRRMNKGGH
jgi:hypothetical protein